MIFTVNNIKLFNISIIGGISGRLVTGYFIWNVFDLKNTEKYSIKWFCGHSFLNLITLGGLLYVPYKYLQIEK